MFFTSIFDIFFIHDSEKTPWYEGERVIWFLFLIRINNSYQLVSEWVGTNYN